MKQFFKFPFQSEHENRISIHFQILNLQLLIFRFFFINFWAKFEALEQMF